MNVTVVEPPVAAGAPVLSFVRAPSQPPEALTLASQVAKAALMAAWVWPNGSVAFVGQLRTTGGDEVTVKVLWQVWVSGAQVLKTLKVTVFTSPHLDGEKFPSLLPVTSQPPFELAVLIQLA